MSATEYRNYRVRWEIDIEATSPEEAAELARDAQYPGSMATVFDVYEDQSWPLEDPDYRWVATIDLTHPENSKFPTS